MLSVTSVESHRIMFHEGNEIEPVVKKNRADSMNDFPLPLLCMVLLHIILSRRGISASY